MCTNEECRKKFDNLKRKCDSGGSVVGKTDKTRRHITIPVRLDDVEIGVENDEVLPKICMVDSILLNPNSYKNIEDILMELKKTA